MAYYRVALTPASSFELRSRIAEWQELQRPYMEDARYLEQAPTHAAGSERERLTLGETLNQLSQA
jgi:hypothetical protein